MSGVGVPLDEQGERDPSYRAPEAGPGVAGVGEDIVQLSSDGQSFLVTGRRRFVDAFAVDVAQQDPTADTQPETDHTIGIGVRSAT